MSEDANLLPLGSIVYLQEGVIPLMIITRQPLLEIEGETYYFDYAGVNQLSGLSNLDEIAYFNQENINEVQFRGYVGNSEDKVLRALSEWKRHNNIQKGNVMKVNMDK